MGKQTDQGTRLETHIRKGAESQGRTARRLAKTGRAHEADVQIEGRDMRPAVAWKSYRQTGGVKRSTLSMVIITEDDFFILLGQDTDHQLGWWIQCKATQRLSVPAILAGLMGWIREHP
jgi:hypothetical protein